MNKRGKRIAPRRHAHRRRHRFHPATILALVMMAAAVSLSFGANFIPKSHAQIVPPVVPAVMNERLTDTGDTARMERLTASLHEGGATAALRAPSSQRKKNTYEKAVTHNAQGQAAEKPQTPPSQAAEDSEQPPASETAPASPQGKLSQDNWNLALVNPWNVLPDSDSVTLTQLKNGQAVDERCYPDLQAMMDDCRAAGLSPLICSSYRSQEKQETLFNNKVNKLIAKGYAKEAAKIEAGKSVAVPGTSEHQLGLAVDIVDVRNQNLDESQARTAVQEWLMEHSWRYGFILRYPNEKSDVTGIIYEPWHYRYVGKEAAKEIYEQGICLEEYIVQQSA